MIELDISIRGVDSTIDQVERRLDDAIESGLDNTRDKGLDAAKNRIREADRVWNREVLNNWQPVTQKSDGKLTYGFINTSEHAGVVNYGAEYTDKKPPVDELMPWVAQKLSHWPGTTREKAFLVQEMIFDRGIRGIHYIEVAEADMRGRTQSEIDKEIKKRFTKAI